MKITIEIKSEGGPIDTSVALVEKTGKKFWELMGGGLRRIGSLSLPPPVIDIPNVRGGF